MGSSRARNSTRRARRRLLLPDIRAILGRFGRAQALITVALRSLEADDRMKSCPEGPSNRGRARGVGCRL